MASFFKTLRGGVFFFAMFLLLLCFSSENLVDDNTMSWCQMVGCLCVELKVSTHQGQVEAGFCHGLSCSCMFWHCIFPPRRQQFILLLYQSLRSITFGAIFIPTFPLPSQVIFGILLKWHKSMDDNKHRDMNIQRRRSGQDPNPLVYWTTRRMDQVTCLPFGPFFPRIPGMP